MKRIKSIVSLTLIALMIMSMNPAFGFDKGINVDVSEIVSYSILENGTIETVTLTSEKVCPDGSILKSYTFENTAFLDENMKFIDAREVMSKANIKSVADIVALANPPSDSSGYKSTSVTLSATASYLYKNGVRCEVRIDSGSVLIQGAQTGTVYMSKGRLVLQQYDESGIGSMKDKSFTPNYNTTYTEYSGFTSYVSLSVWHPVLLCNALCFIDFTDGYQIQLCVNCMVEE